MKEILPGIWTWSVFNEEKKLDFNGYLIANEDGCVLIDPPPVNDEQAGTAERLGPPSVILITNRNHMRDSAGAARRWGARILIHEADAGAVSADYEGLGTFRDGDRLPGGLHVITLTGQKSPGESALLCPKANALILGDALIGRTPGSLNLLPDDKYADVGKARVGLRRLLEQDFDAVLLGDGTSLTTGGRRAVEAFLAG